MTAQGGIHITLPHRAEQEPHAVVNSVRRGKPSPAPEVGKRSMRRRREVPTTRQGTPRETKEPPLPVRAIAPNHQAAKRCEGEHMTPN